MHRVFKSCVPTMKSRKGFEQKTPKNTKRRTKIFVLKYFKFSCILKKYGTKENKKENILW